jgi:hypothetical protein
MKTGVAMSDTDAVVEAMLQIVQQRLDTPISSEEELERLKKGLAGVAERARTLSSFKLTNAEEPYSVFSVCRAEDL